MFRFVSSLSASDDRASFDRALRWLYGFVRPHGWALCGLLILSVSSSCLVLAQPWLIKIVIDKGLIGRDRAVLVGATAGMVALGLLATMLSGFNRFAYTRVSGKILFALRGRVYAHLQLLPPSFYGRRRVGELMSRIDGDVAEIQRFAVDSMFSAITNVVGLAGALVFLVGLSWKLALLLLVLIPAELCWLRWMRGKVERQIRTMRESAADVSSFLAESIVAMKFIQSVGQCPREAARFDAMGQRHLGRLLKLQATEFLTQAVPGTLVSLSRAGAFLVGGWWVIEGRWQLGALVAFSTYLGMAISPVQGLLGLYMALQRMSVSLQRVMELCDEPAGVVQTGLPLQPSSTGGALTLDGVWFTHPARPIPILRGAGAHIPFGRKVAISGPSGVGKTTLIDLLARHYDPQQGNIAFDGVDLRWLDLAAWRRCIAVVSQDIVLFRGSLLYNLTYGAPDATTAEVARAVRLARLEPFVASLPEGFDTEIGERGQQLSGGQKQRIAIARALLQDPRILVLDEATSAVDEATEREVIAAIDDLFGDRTRILISHRPATLRHVDLHFDLVDGALVRRADVEERA